MEKVRTPVVAGQFYDGNKDMLKELIKKCFLDERGPGKLPKIKKSQNKLLGIVVPHAGYIYSGSIAAHSYHYLANTGFADTFIIIGPNHTGIGSAVSVITEGEWMTPLGSSKINITLAKKIFKGIIDKDQNAHKYEHSIEVQLPFLQFIAGSKNFNFVPICMAVQDTKTSTEVGNIITDAIQKFDKQTVIIASSDFSHTGFNYSSMPPEGIRIDEYAKKQDMLAIDKILNLDPGGLIDTVNQNDITMCGYGPVAVMLTVAKNLGAKKAELLKYSTSYEVHPGTSCVGYGAIAVY